MRIIVSISLFLLSSLFGTAQVTSKQNCNDPLCKKIKGLMENEQNLKNEIETLRTNLRKKDEEVKKMLTQLNSQRKISKQLSLKLQKLSFKFDSLSQAGQTLIDSLNKTHLKLNASINQVQKISESNKELAFLIEQYKGEKSDSELDLEKHKKDIEDLSYLSSYIKQIDLVQIGENSLTIKSPQVTGETEFKGLSTSLNNYQISISGDYFTSKNGQNNTTIKVKLLIYFNQSLFQTFDDTLKINNQKTYNSFNHYELNCIKKIDKSFPSEKGILSVAVIETDRYEHQTFQHFNFWQLFFNGKFPLTSIKPKFPKLYLTDREQINKAISIGKFNSSSEIITLEIYDSGIQDNDQASFYLNGTAIIQYCNLSKDSPFIKEISLRKGKNDLAIFANKSGTIGSCTTLVKIKASGKLLHEVRLSGSVGYCEKLEIYY